MTGLYENEKQLQLQKNNSWGRETEKDRSRQYQNARDSRNQDEKKMNQNMILARTNPGQQ